MKRGKLEKNIRVRKVQDWILEDLITTDIVQKCIKLWGVSDRQALRYVSEANDGFSKITEKKLEKRLSYHIQRRNKLLRDLDEKQKKTPAGIGVQLNILQDIAKLEKLYALRVEVGGPDGAAIQTDSTHRVIFEDYAAD